MLQGGVGHGAFECYLEKEAQQDTIVCLHPWNHVMKHIFFLPLETFFSYQDSRYLWIVVALWCLYGQSINNR